MYFTLFIENGKDIGLLQNVEGKEGQQNAQRKRKQIPQVNILFINCPFPVKLPFFLNRFSTFLTKFSCIYLLLYVISLFSDFYNYDESLHVFTAHMICLATSLLSSSLSLLILLHAKNSNINLVPKLNLIPSLRACYL